MGLIEVGDAADPRLEVYRMVRDRDMAGRRGAFMIEGRVVLEALLRRGRYPLRSVLVSEKRLGGLESLLASLPEEVPVYVLDHEAMVGLVGFNIHRGLMAEGERRPEPSAAQVLGGLSGGGRRVLVLEGLTNADNVGASFRNAAAFGADAVLLDETCCDPLYRKSIRVSAGCVLGVPFSRREPIQALYGALRAASFTIAALGLGERSVSLGRGLDLGGAGQRLAIVLGTEGHGLSPQAVAGADLHLRIPMAEGVDSLNVAVAGAVALFALG